MRLKNGLKIIRQPQENILVVAHEETLRVFVAWYEGNVPDERLRDVHIGNCEYRCYRSGRRGWRNSAVFSK